MKYSVLIGPDEKGMFIAQVPTLPGCVSQGRTRGEAVVNIKEAITTYLGSLDWPGEPEPPSGTEESVEVEV